MVRKSLVCITLGVLASLAWAGGEPLQCLGPVRALEHEAFLVSPRFSGDGQSLRVKGRGGKGDYLLRLPDASLTPLAPQSTEISLDGQGWQVMGDFRHRVYDGRLEFGEPGRWRVLEAAGVWGPRLSPDGNTLSRWATIRLSSLKPTRLTPRQRKVMFSRPDPHRYRHEYLVTGGNIVELKR